MLKSKNPREKVINYKAEESHVPKIRLVFFSSLDNILPCVQTIHPYHEGSLVNLKLYTISDHLTETQSVSMEMQHYIAELKK